MQQIKKDFDRIALLTEPEQDYQATYDRFLLGFVPRGCDHLLEIGCGTGAFTQLLARCATHVTAVDLSGEMIRIARIRSASLSNIDYQVGDALQMDFPANRFDSIVTIATLHHLPLTASLEKMKEALKPGGVMIIHDLLASEGAIDTALDLVRLPVSMAVRWYRTGRLRSSRELRRAWKAHGKGEKYLTASEVRAIRDNHLPEAYVKEHLLWRYTIVWHK